MTGMESLSMGRKAILHYDDHPHDAVHWNCVQNSSLCSQYLRQEEVLIGDRGQVLRSFSYNLDKEDEDSFAANRDEEHFSSENNDDAPNGYVSGYSSCQSLATFTVWLVRLVSCINLKSRNNVMGLLRLVGSSCCQGRTIWVRL